MQSQSKLNLPQELNLNLTEDSLMDKYPRLTDLYIYQKHIKKTYITGLPINDARRVQATKLNEIIEKKSKALGDETIASILAIEAADFRDEEEKEEKLVVEEKENFEWAVKDSLRLDEIEREINERVSIATGLLKEIYIEDEYKTALEALEKATKAIRIRLPFLSENDSVNYGPLNEFIQQLQKLQSQQILENDVEEKKSAISQLILQISECNPNAKETDYISQCKTKIIPQYVTTAKKTGDFEELELLKLELEGMLHQRALENAAEEKAIVAYRLLGQISEYKLSGDEEAYLTKYTAEVIPGYVKSAKDSGSLEGLKLLNVELQEMLQKKELDKKFDQRKDIISLRKLVDEIVKHESDPVKRETMRKGLNIQVNNLHGDADFSNNYQITKDLFTKLKNDAKHRAEAFAELIQQLTKSAQKQQRHQEQRAAEVARAEAAASEAQQRRQANEAAKAKTLADKAAKAKAAADEAAKAKAAADRKKAFDRNATFFARRKDSLDGLDQWDVERRTKQSAEAEQKSHAEQKQEMCQEKLTAMRNRFLSSHLGFPQGLELSDGAQQAGITLHPLADVRIKGANEQKNPTLGDSDLDLRDAAPNRRNNGSSSN
ncbi:MAG TPA: hypothetical protein VLI69_04225 [Gammaproteobacteria bacterium]|nr:hypothetical protein [Gammaproteobacteria bacterium]